MEGVPREATERGALAHLFPVLGGLGAKHEGTPVLPLSHARSLCPFREVLSYEFWVLSCLAQYWGEGEGLRGSIWLIWFV